MINVKDFKKNRFKIIVTCDNNILMGKAWIKPLGLVACETNCKRIKTSLIKFVSFKKYHSAIFRNGLLYLISA